jgi:flavin-binding protein dodecin
VEIVGTSSVSLEDAIKNGIAEASNSVRNMSWFEVTEQRGMIKEGKVQEFQVVLKIGFKIER